MRRRRGIATGGLLTLIWGGCALFNASQAARIEKPFERERMVVVETMVASVSARTVSTGTPSRPSTRLDQELHLPEFPDLRFSLASAIETERLPGARARLTMLGDPAAAQRESRQGARPVMEVVGVEVGDLRLLDPDVALSRYESAVARHDRLVGFFGVAAVVTGLLTVWGAWRRIAAALKLLR